MKIVIYFLLFLFSLGIYASEFDHITLFIINDTDHDIVLYRAGFGKGKNHIYPFAKPGNDIIFIPAGKEITKTDYASDRFNQILTYASRKYIYTSYGISPHKDPDWIFSIYHDFNNIVVGDTSAAIGSSLNSTSPIIINTVKKNKIYIIILQKNKINK
ncbi:MAG: hypothetical protein GY756_19270 [bacterium]|nr:hypothetical protein [bacterium]